jgi:asparagine synthase (glutamine-hydrolysing)
MGSRLDPRHDPSVPEAFREKAGALRAVVVRAVERNSAPGILLSGGLDTSIVAEIAARRGLHQAVTVLVGEAAPDAPFATGVARHLGLSHRVVATTPEELLEEVPRVVRVLRTFDPMEVRNSIVVARGLREARAMGVEAVLTGDAADELFGGYSFLWDKSEEEFARSSERMSRIMRFSAIPLGEDLGVGVRVPFLDPEVVAFARTLSKGEKVAQVGGGRHGKYLLRLAFPEVENRWRRKDPIEVGSGSRVLPDHLRAAIDPGEFERERARIRREERVDIRDPEHLAYYREFRKTFGDRPPLVRDGEDPCSACGFELASAESDFCLTCGAWPARRTTRSADRRPVPGLPGPGPRAQG